MQGMLLLLACLVGAASASEVALPSNNRTVLLWMFRHDNDTDAWNGMINELAAHRTNVTHIAMCTHRLEDNGTFGYQYVGDVPTGRIMEEKAREIAKLGFVMTPLIDVVYPDYKPKLAFLQNSTKRAAFIVDAVAKAKAEGYAGYNMDIELSAPKEFGVAWAVFLNEFADGLHKAGLTLTNTIAGYCPPWFDGATCDQYVASRVDNVITMNTYQKGAAKFTKYVDFSVEKFGVPKFTIGMSNSQDPDNLHDHSVFDHAVQKGVKNLALWVMAGPYDAATTIWEDLGYFLHFAH